MLQGLASADCSEATIDYHSHHSRRAINAVRQQTAPYHVDDVQIEPRSYIESSRSSESETTGWRLGTVQHVDPPHILYPGEDSIASSLASPTGNRLLPSGDHGRCVLMAACATYLYIISLCNHCVHLGFSTGR